ncbi:uncharacterized protein [Henckelia pumila]|uniref:uncharacterized protein isoform X2 n=1 Tax=Henckelia pumila TaxID=405737 RepID=UPI003C6E8A15
MPVGGGSTHINADKNATLRNLAEIALEFYNDTKSKKFKLVKVCKVNTIAFRYSGVTFRAREDGSEESPLFRAVVFLCKPLFCEIKEDNEVTLLPNDDDYAGPKRACEIEDFPLSICAVEPGEKKSDDDSKYPEGMSAMAYMIQSYYDSKYPKNTSAIEARDIKPYDDSKYPALSKSHRVQGISLSRLREMCDLCMEIPRYCLTRRVGKRAGLINLADIALTFYNDTKSMNFKLVKVCKVNTIAVNYSALTFRAQEDGSEESLLFRGVVFGMRKPLFCEIKEDDEVTLLPWDDDYISSELGREIEDVPPSIRKNYSGDGSATGSGDVAGKSKRQKTDLSPSI